MAANSSRIFYDMPFPNKEIKGNNFRNGAIYGYAISFTAYDAIYLGIWYFALF